MYTLECFEIEPQTDLRRRAELDTQKQSDAPNVLDHLEPSEAFAQPGPYVLARVPCAFSEALLLKHLQCRQSRPHRQPVFAEGRGVNDGALQRIVHAIIDG